MLLESVKMSVIMPFKKAWSRQRCSLLLDNLCMKLFLHLKKLCAKDGFYSKDTIISKNEILFIC